MPCAETVLRTASTCLPGVPNFRQLPSNFIARDHVSDEARRSENSLSALYYVTKNILEILVIVQGYNKNNF